MRQNSGRMLFQAGMSLLEVLIGILVFAIGIMALTQLQGGLARSAGDANTRTVAINIAEQVIERQRGFSRITTDPAGIEYAYADIATAPKYTVPRGDLSFNVETTVTRYWYNRTTQLFTTTEPLVAAVSDFKLMTVKVDWGQGSRRVPSS